MGTGNHPTVSRVLGSHVIRVRALTLLGGGCSVRTRLTPNHARGTATYDHRHCMIVTLYDRVTDVTTDKSSPVTWDSFADQLTVHARREGKDGLGFSPASFKPGSVREDDGVIEVGALVFDVDKLTEAEAGIVLDRLHASGLRFVWHTTHSHAPPDKASLRVAVALSRPVAAHEWRAFYHAAAKHLGLPYEVKCCNPSRFWYLPSCAPGAEPEAEAVNGIPLDVDSITVTAESSAPAPSSHASSVPTGDRPPASPALLAEVMARLAALGPATQGHGGDALTYQACALALHGFALSESEALTVLSLWDQSNVPPWGPQGLLTKMRNAGRYAKGTLGESREVFESRGAFPGTTAPTVGVALELLNVEPPAPAGEYYAADLGAFLGQDDPDDSTDNWIIQGILAAGVPQVIGGPPKSHKTFIAEHMLITIAAGLPHWLGQTAFTVTQTNVLMLLREDSFRESRRRIWRLSRGLGLDPRDLEGRLWVDCLTPFYFNQDIDIVRLGRTIKERNIGVIVIDSLSRTHQGDENSVKEMGIVTSRWNEICQSNGGVAVPIIHHFNKWGEGPLLQRLRGTSDIGAVVRHIVGVSKQEQGESLLEFDGNLHPVLDPFLVKIADGVDPNGKKTIAITYEGDARLKAFEGLERKVLTLLAQAAPNGLSAMALLTAAKPVKNETLITCRDRLKESGKIILHGERYHIATVAPKAAATIDDSSLASAFLKE